MYMIIFMDSDGVQHRHGTLYHDLEGAKNRSRYHANLGLESKVINVLGQTVFLADPTTVFLSDKIDEKINWKREGF